MTKWIKRSSHWVAKEATLPGVFKMKDGGWYVRKRITDPKTGKLKEVARALDVETAEEAFGVLQQLVQEVRRGGTQETPKMRFSVYATSLLERKVAKGKIKSAAGLKKYKTHLKHHLIPAFGDYYLDQISKQDIEAWLVKQSQSGYAPTTVNSWLSTLKVIINSAVAEYELPKNPIAGVEDLDTSDHRTYTAEEPNSLKPEDVPRFLDKMQQMYPQHYAMTLLGFSTGLRPSSLRPLRRKGSEADVLWDEGGLLVRRSHTDGNDVMNKTKTGKDQRLTLPQTLLDALQAHADSLAPGPQQHSELLFPSTTGGFRSRSCLDKPFQKVSKAIKLPYKFTPRGLRRTYQDLARRAEIGDVVLRSISGHATQQMQQHYSTVAPEEQRQAMGKVVDLCLYRKTQQTQKTHQEDPAASPSGSETGASVSPSGSPETAKAPEGARTVGAGEGTRTPDVNLGKVPQTFAELLNYLESEGKGCA